VFTLLPQPATTSHGSVVEYNGQWWAFYHTADLSGTGLLRCICADRCFSMPMEPSKLSGKPCDQGSAYENIIRTVPCTIEAEDYNEGGKGIAYWDNTSGNGPNEYRRGEDVDIAKYRPRNMYYVTDIAQGEYLNYTFDVSETGIYSIDFVIGTPQSGQTQNFILNLIT
jgi:hypothetical protein